VTVQTKGPLSLLHIFLFRLSVLVHAYTLVLMKSGFVQT